jgi:hypothetical protein
MTQQVKPTMTYAILVAAALAILTTSVNAQTPQPPAQANHDQWFAASAKVIDELDKGQFDAILQNSIPAVRDALPAAKLGSIWNAIVEQSGPFQAIDGTDYADRGAYHTVISDCRFQKTSIDITLSFDSDRRLAGIFFGPHAAPAPAVSLPDGLCEQSITVGANGQWPLPGTLTLPAGPGPFACVVLVHGSGPEDEDETIGSNKLFRDLAWGLAQHGVAVLRYVKRTKQFPERCAAMTDMTTKDEVIDDAVLAANLAAQSDRIDPKRVFILGHSLGAMLIPRIAARAKFAAGFIVMAGATRPIEDLIVEQYKQRLAGTDPATAKPLLDQIEKQVATVKSAGLTNKTPVSELPFGAPASYWLDVRNMHAAVDARAIAQPLLILQGGEDQQVPSKEIDGWRAALAGKHNVEYRLYPDLSHLFIAGQPTVNDYLSHPGRVSETAIEDIAKWVKSVSAASRRATPIVPTRR